MDSGSQGKRRCSRSPSKRGASNNKPDGNRSRRHSGGRSSSPGSRRRDSDGFRRRRSRSVERWGRRDSRDRRERRDDYWPRSRSPERWRNRRDHSRDDRYARRGSRDRFNRGSSVEDRYDRSPPRNFFDSYGDRRQDIDEGPRQFPGASQMDRTIELPGLGGLRGYDIVELKETPSVQQALEVLRQYNIKGYQLVMKEEFDAKPEGQSLPPPQNFGMNRNMPAMPFEEPVSAPTPASKRVFVDNIDFRTTRYKLSEVFKMAGKVLNVLVKHDQQSSSYSATVEYEHPFEAMRAASMLNGQMLHSRAISVTIAESEKEPFMQDSMKKECLSPPKRNVVAGGFGPGPDIQQNVPPADIPGRGFMDLDSGNRFDPPNRGIGGVSGPPFPDMDVPKNMPPMECDMNRNRMDPNMGNMNRAQHNMGMTDLRGFDRDVSPVGGGMPRSYDRPPPSGMEGPYRGGPPVPAPPERDEIRHFDGPGFNMNARDMMPRNQPGVPVGGGNMGPLGGGNFRPGGNEMLPGREGMGRRGMMPEGPFFEQNRLDNEPRDDFGPHEETKGYVNTASGDLRKVISRGNDSPPPPMAGGVNDFRNNRPGGMRPNMPGDFRGGPPMMGGRDIEDKNDFRQGFTANPSSYDDRRGDFVAPNLDVDDRSRPLDGVPDGRLMGRQSNFQRDFGPFGNREGVGGVGSGRLSPPMMPRNAGFPDGVNAGRRAGEGMGSFSGNFNAPFDERNRLEPPRKAEGYVKDRPFDEGFENRRNSARDFFGNNFGDRFGDGNRDMGRSLKDSCSILIKNLPYDCTVKALKERFLDIGELDSVEMKPKGMAYVRFFYERDARRAVDLMNGRYMNGRPMQVSLV